jgi:hypothetical protein
MAGRFTAMLAVLALAGCDLGDGPTERKVATPSGEATTAPSPTLTQPRPSRIELVVQAIRSCEVKRIVFAHGDNTWITYRGGNTVHTRRLDTEEIERAAWEHADPCDILIGIE